MKRLKQMARAGLLAMVLLLITLATAFAIDTGEIEVTEGIDGQPANRIRNTAVAMDGSGNAVVVWSHQEGVYRTVYARRYDSSGASTALISVETLYGSGITGYVDVAMNDSGAFVVAWTQGFTDSDGYSVHAALYSASANLVRGPFQVNTSEAGDQWSPSVAIDDTGNFLVAWDQKDSINTSVEEGIYAQRYDNTGQPDGSEVLVNTSPEAGVRHQVDVSMAGDGRAIAVWHHEAFEDNDAIKGQRFNSDGSRNSGEIEISPRSDFLLRPAVAMDDSGAFVVVWEGENSLIGIHRFNADGSSADSGHIDFAGEWLDIAMDDNGNFAVVWQSGDGNAVGTYAALFDSTGTVEGDFRVNVTTDAYEEFPTVAMRDSDQYIVAWSRYLGPNDGMDGIYARFFSGPPGNTAPVANDNGYSTDEDVTLNVTAPGILENDSDADGDPLTAALESNVSHGSLSLNADGSFTYTPSANYHGPDSFTYSASDGELASNVATVTINVISINDAPVATDDAATTDEDAVATLDLAANDTDVDGNLDLNSLSITSQPDNGTLTNHADGTVTYAPNANYYGPDSFNYEICDSGGLCDAAAVDLTVNPVNDAPVANAGGPYAGDEGGAIALSGGASDVDGDALSYSWSSDGPCTFSDVNALGPTVTCADDGTFTATLTVDDGMTTSNSDAVVTVANVPPTIDLSGNGSTDEGANYALTLGAITDPGEDTVTEYVVHWGDGSSDSYTGAGEVSHIYDDGPASHTISVDLVDEDGTHIGAGSIAVTVDNVAPTIDLSGNGSTDEGASYALTLGAVTDPGEDAVTEYVVHWGDGSSDSYTSGGEVFHVYDDGPASHTISVDLVDEDGTHTGAGSIAVTVDNVAPTIDFLEAPTDPVAIDAQPVAIQVIFSDPGAADTHETTVDWGDGTIDTYSNASPVSADHIYAVAGVYTLIIAVADDEGASDTATYEYVVIYDPDGGFVTGRGRIHSQAGSCYVDDVCAGAEGDARFGFVSRYNQGATIPTGRTDFVFRAGDLDFESTSYNWLIVNQAGTNAQFRGEGLIHDNSAPNGADYQFMIWAGEGTGPNGEDTFRIQIWYEFDGTETLVYDNGFDQAIESGKIRVQAK